MRVGINLIFLRPGGVGGVETYVYELLAAMLRQQTVHLIAFCSLEAGERLRRLGNIDVANVIHGNQSSARRALAETVGIRAAMRRHPVDVLFSPGSWVPLLAPAGVPQVATIHDLQHLSYPEYFSVRVRLARRVRCARTLQRCAHLIAISEFTRSDILRRLRAPPDRVTTVLSGVPNTSRPPAAALESVRLRYQLPRRYVCYPAMAAPHKNHAVLVRAFSELRDMCSDPPGLVLTGKRGPAWADVRREIDRLRVADLVRDLGYIPYDDVLAVLAGSQALAFPSLYEGFGLPVLEAQQLSIPVLASAIPSLCEVGGDGALYIAPSEPTAWARAILRATTHHESQQTLISAGRANARRFSWDSCAAQTFDVLRRAIDNDSRLLFNKA